MTKQTILAITAWAVLCSAAVAGTVNIALVPVGDPGNAADTATGYGAVSYSYSIGEYDVTMGQYAAFLNSVAATSDPYGLWTTSMSSATPTYGITRTSTSAGYSYSLVGNSASVPVTYVSWYDSVRFVNWLQNGEPTGPEGPGTTETGSYLLAGSVTRGANANWVLPTINEWYKSAYYSGGGTDSSYWEFPTQNDSVPTNVLSATGTNNANYEAVLGNPPVVTRSDPAGWLTPVGAFADSPGPFGTFDQGGDVWQWNEDGVDGGLQRGLQGGSFAGSYGGMYFDNAGYGNPPTLQDESVGFRVAYVPEPPVVVLLGASAFVGLLIFSRVRHSKKTGDHSCAACS